jgi:hypothetical protein
MLLKTYALRVAAAAAIFLISSEMTSAGTSHVAVIGPIDQINCAASTYRVLGVSFKATSKSVMSRLCSSQTISTPSYVVAAGLRGDSGKNVGTELAELRSELYVAGASLVFIRGVVTRINAATGEFEVAGANVFALTGQTPALGEAVDIVGTQPLLGAVIVADTVYPSSDGSDARIANAIIGSGASKNAIIGSGSSAKAIIGSGSSSAAIIGSGANSSAIIGSGTSSKAIIGSGSSNSAIIGSGSATKAIIGSGANNIAIIGSGASSSAIIGSGAL